MYGRYNRKWNGNDIIMRTAVIILNWNGFEMLTACIRSLSEAKGDFFVVVADNGSVDGSPKKFMTWMKDNGMRGRLVVENEEDMCHTIAERDIIVYSLRENYGFAKGNNKAITFAMRFSPKRLLLLNNDTEVEPDFLVRLESFQKNNPEYKVLTPLIHFFYDKTKIWNAGGRLNWGFRRYFYANRTVEDIKEKVFIPITFVTGCALYVSPSLLDDGNTLLTERFFFGEEDFDFSLRMKQKSVKMACVLDSVIYHKVGSSVKKEMLPGKLYIHYLNRFIDVRLHYGKLFSSIWMMVYKPYIFRTLDKSGCPKRLRHDFVKRLYRNASIKNEVTALDFKNALANGWSGKNEKELRLFILADTSSPHTKRWVSSIAERGVRIFLFSFNNSDMEYYDRIRNVECYAMNIFSGLKEQRKNGAFEKIRYLKTFSEMKRCIREFKPDILHAHYATSYGLLGVLSGFHPLVISMWGSDIYYFPHVSSLHRMLLKFNLSKAERLLSTSNCMAREASAYTDNKIDITPFGVDTDKFKPTVHCKKGDEFVIGTVKTLAYNYGIDVLMKAFSMVKQKNPEYNLRLSIVGGGPERSTLEKLAVELGISDVTVFAGLVSNEEVPEILSSFDVFVALSRKESFGVAALEAMSCEVPVVVSDADGFVEVVPDEAAGFVIPKDDVDAAAEKITYLMKNRDMARQMGRYGREYVIKKYSWNSSVDNMMSVYKSLLKNEK